MMIVSHVVARHTLPRSLSTVCVVNLYPILMCVCVVVVVVVAAAPSDADVMLM